MALEEPRLKTPAAANPQTSSDTFMRRLSHYLTGLAIGMVLLILLLYARWSWRQKHAEAPADGAPPAAETRGQQQLP